MRDFYKKLSNLLKVNTESLNVLLLCKTLELLGLIIKTLYGVSLDFILSISNAETIIFQNTKTKTMFCIERNLNLEWSFSLEEAELPAFLL